MKNFSKRVWLISTISIIGIIGFSLTAAASDSAIPDWVKNNAKWWSEGVISEADYITSLEYLISNGIIDVQVPFAQVTTAQNILSDDERAQSFSVTFYDGLIQGPVTVDTFIKFEATSSSATSRDTERPIYVL